MSVVYRKSWPALDGATYTLDIVPYDTDVDGSVITLSEADANLIEVGEVVTEFDELPVGLMKPASMTLRMVINRLPSALQTYLRTKQDPATKSRNTFILKRDYAGTTTVLFAGVQTRINSQSYERQNSEYIVEIECTDALHYVMTSYKPTSTSFFSGGAYLDFTAPYDTQVKRTKNAFELLAATANPGLTAGYQSLGNNEEATFWTLALTMSVFTFELSNLAKALTLRQTYAGDAFDNTGELSSNAITNVAKFRRTTRTTANGARTAGSYLDADELYLLTHISRDGQLVGGLASPNDKYGWGKYETHWDLFKDLLECFMCQASYRYEIGTGLSAGKIYAIWEVQPIVPSIVTGIDIMRALDEPTVTETESAIGRAEVRFATEYPDQSSLQHIANSGAVRADRQYTVDMAVHNCPIHKLSTNFATLDFVQRGFIHCNQLWYRDTGATSKYGSDNLVKVHENLSLAYTGALDFDYDESTISHNPPLYPTAYTTWAIGTQQVTGLPFALADAYARVFGQDDLATVELRLPMAYRIMQLGLTYPITGQITSDIPHLAWSRAVPVSIASNPMDNTQTVKFMLIPLP